MNAVQPFHPSKQKPVLTKRKEITYGIKKTKKKESIEKMSKRRIGIVGYGHLGKII